MLSRCIISLCLFSCFVSTAASAAYVFPLSDDHVANAARQIRQKNYKGAWEAASKAQQGGAREFMLGITAQKLEQFEEAAAHFANAAGSFPILADYSLYYQARSLSRASRLGDALLPLQMLLKQFPDSPLSRPAQQFYADTLYTTDDFKNAYSAYQRFIEKFPLGADSISATYHSALCLEKLGDQTEASVSLRNIWLRYPASAFAGKAEKDLQRLRAAGNIIPPYTTDEKLQYATRLYDLKKYEEAARALQEIPVSAQPPGAADRYLLKAGQALFKARQYREAEAQFSALLEKKTSAEITTEATYWLAKAFDKTGRQEEAVNCYLKVADSTANYTLADRALFEASFIRKDQKKGVEGISLLKKILLQHPNSSLRQSATWEIGWRSYLAGDLKTAVEYLYALSSTEGSREKALYWYGRTLSALGDVKGSQGTFSLLLKEFPFGFYAQYYEKENSIKSDLSVEVANMCDILPIPAGYDRIKALIGFGLYDEARKELSLTKKVSGKGAVPGIARLYLEMEDYNGAYNLLNNEQPRRLDKDNFYQWGLCFPLAYQDHVTRTALAHHIPESLVYAVIKAESSFSPTALSPVGAVGLMQLMPTTAAAVANGKGKFNVDTLTNPKINIDFGIKHLQDLLVMYENDSILAIAAYNAGAGNVNRWRKRLGGMRPDEFVESIPFAETREYVKKVVAGAGVYSRLYKLQNIPPFSPPPRKEAGTVEIESTAAKEIGAKATF